MKYLLLFFSLFSMAQQTQSVDFKTASGTITINPILHKVSGTVSYDFLVKNSIDTIKIDAQNMTFSHLKINGKDVRFVNSGKTLNLFEGYQKGKNKLSFFYEATPKQTMYFNGFDTSENLGQIWTQGQGKYTSHWFPSFDDVNEKMVFGLSITFNKNYAVISNGTLVKTKQVGENTIWNYQMNKPMSSYLLMIAIGKFNKIYEKSKSKTILEYYFKPDDAYKFEPTYRYSKAIFDYLESEIGVKYPWEIYRQIPVEDFLYAGMENTTATIFSQDFVVDSIAFNDRNYVEVNAHELAHQWFGDLVTAKSGKHHWLQEGFATYYALLAEREVFGDDYFYFELYRSSLRLRNAAKTDTIPVLHEKASTLSFYEKGAWALHVLREKIGKDTFKQAVKNYLEKHEYQNVDTDDFLNEIKAVSNFNTDDFKKKWLESYQFPTEEANTLLKKNKFIDSLFVTQSLRKVAFKDKVSTFKEILKSNSYYPIKTEILYQLKDVDFKDKRELLEIAMKTNSIEVRKAIAQQFIEIPTDFKLMYESLLNDDSYETQEIALNNLWENFELDRERYLLWSKNWVGGNDKNLRILHLKLSLLTNHHTLNDSEKYYKYQRDFKELLEYSSAKYESSIRTNAFAALNSIGCTDEVYFKNLVNASTHYSWQFAKFAKEQLRYLLKSAANRKQFETLLSQCNDKEQRQLQRLLEEK